MRLLETTDGSTYRLTEEYLHQSQIPAYAILSHTWTEGHEVTFDDINKDERSKYRKLRSSLQLRPHSRKKGYDKLRFCAKQAKRDGLRYFWVDTCCIDKSNSPELQRAINSMFQWYQNATKCYVFLSDVSSTNAKTRYGSSGWEEAFKRSRWFTRGWTLQELLAPTTVEFFSKQGICLGSRVQLKQLIHDITNIPQRALSGVSLDEFDVDQKLSWAAERQTTRIEDEVYALLGIFGIDLPFIYDEGYDRALRRLLEKIYNAPHEAQEHERVIKSMVPFGRDNDFVARDDLSALHRIFEVPGRHAALVGLIGVGKSQIAIECTYRMLDEAPDLWIFWVHAETKASVRKSYHQIGEKVGIIGWDDPMADIMQLVYAWLLNEANGRWMMVIDGADDAGVFSNDTPDSCPSDKAGLTPPEQPISTYIPRTPSGSILVTSRSHEVALMLTEDKSDIIEVGPMTDQNARTLLQTKLNAAVKDSEADEMIRLLDHMPLALTQAAAFINRTPRMSVTKYIEELNDSRAAEILDRNMVDIRRYDQTSNSVMATWQMSFNYIRSRSESAARLLSLMSLFDRQGIPGSLLLEGMYIADTGHKVWDLPDDYTGGDEQRISSFEHDMYMLTSFCLVKANADATKFDMHGLVQMATKKWLEVNGELHYWNQLFLSLMAWNFPGLNYENLSICESLFPHAQAAIEIIPDEEALYGWALLSFRMGVYVETQGAHNEAYELIHQSYRVRRILCGEDCWSTLNSLNSLAEILGKVGRRQEAIELLIRALEAKTRTLGPDDTCTLYGMINLARAYNGDCQWTEAENLLLQAIEVSKTVLGQDHEITHDAMFELAQTYADQKRWAESIDLSLRLLRTYEKKHGFGHPNTETTLGNLASTYRRAGRYSEAEQIQLETLKRRETQPGYEVDVLTVKSQLASTLRCQGRLDEAEKMQLLLIEESKERLGPDHFSTMTYTSHLAETYCRQGRWKEAEALETKRLECCMAQLGHNSVSTLDSKQFLAEIYRSQGILDKAERYDKETVEALVEKYGDDHYMTLQGKMALAQTYTEQGRLDETAEIEEYVVRIKIKTMGPYHRETLFDKAGLALTYKRQGRLRKAIESLERVLIEYEDVLGKEDESTVMYTQMLERWRKAEIEG